MMIQIHMFLLAILSHQRRLKSLLATSLAWIKSLDGVELWNLTRCKICYLEPILSDGKRAVALEDPVAALGAQLLWRRRGQM